MLRHQTLSSISTLRPSLLSALIIMCLTGCSSVNQVRRSVDTDNNETYVDAFEPVQLSDIALRTTFDAFKTGDTADISVYNVDSLSGTYIVDRAGNINFPLIGTVQVAGLSTMDLQQTLTYRYGERYLQNPNINVKLDAQDFGRIVVDGAVNTPGVFDIDRIVRLTEAIALAEGLNDYANNSNIFIIRTINGERKISEVSLSDIRRLDTPDPQIIPDDVIFVQDSTSRVMFREFLKTVPLLNTALIYGTRP